MQKHPKVTRNASFMHFLNSGKLQILVTVVIMPESYRSQIYHHNFAYEAEFKGASEFLNRRLNEEFQRAFEAGIPSSAIYPSPEIYHIGTPSDRTTSKGFRSALSHGTSSVPSHPTSSPVSFGPSTPVQSASAAPVGWQSSPGRMSDVGSTLTPPGLPLRDPPRMAGSHGYL